MKYKEYAAVVQKILHQIDEGIHVVDKNGTSIVYNEAMGNIEKMNPKDVLKKPFEEVFQDLKNEDSTMIQALKSGKKTLNQVQTYSNKYGKKITTVNTTVPVFINDEIVAAVEISKNITDIEEMSNKILDLNKEIREPKKVKGQKIKTYSFSNIVGNNIEFRKVIDLAKRASKTVASVLIYGETGTGKELIAQSIHFDGNRKDKPFLAQNCAALPETLLEGILFGTAKGGFTGAVDRPGLFEQANGGTLLLDEINSMPYELQGKLLRVLQENYIRRVGGTRDIPIDVRIIATLNEEASILIKKGKLRPDLYYRLNVIPISVPSLRERPDDILLLADKFIDKYNQIYNKNIWMLSDKAKEKLLNYNYPGNVRELENVIMAAMSLTDSENVIGDRQILVNINDGINIEDGLKIDIEDIGIDEYLYSIEKKIIKKILLESNYNITKAAEKMKIKRQTLQHKIKKYNLKSTPNC